MIDHTFRSLKKIDQDINSCAYQGCGKSREWHDKGKIQADSCGKMPDSYRAVLVHAEGQERVIQLFSNHLANIIDMATKEKKVHPEARVDIYIVREELIKSL